MSEQQKEEDPIDLLYIALWRALHTFEDLSTHNPISARVELPARFSVEGKKIERRLVWNKEDGATGNLHVETIPGGLVPFIRAPVIDLVAAVRGLEEMHGRLVKAVELDRLLAAEVRQAAEAFLAAHPKE